MDERSFHPNAGTDVPSTTESRLRLLIDTGLRLASERRLDVVVRVALDAGIQLSGAGFGAFFFQIPSASGVTYQLAETSGVGDAAVSTDQLQQLMEVLAPIVAGADFLRSEDMTADARFSRPPVNGSPRHELRVRSCLTASVRSREGEVLGALLLGHSRPAIFTTEIEAVVATIAAQAGAAIDHSRLTETVTGQIAVADAVRADQRSTSERLRHALEAAQLGTWSWDLKTDLLDLDKRAAELFGVQPRVPIARKALREQIVYVDDKGATPADLREVLRSGGQYTAEYRIHAGQETFRWIAANGIATVSEVTGEVVGMTGILQDITTRKTQEASLRTSEKLAATGRLAATIAHEINNPLEAITNLIYLAKTDPATPDSVCSLLETADDELARVAQLAQQTLGFYRDARRPVTIDMNELVQAVVNLFKRKLSMKRLQCTVDFEPGLSIIGLEGEIRQVMSNLLVNAIDASAKTGGNIRIRGRRRGMSNKGVSVLVADLGSGIPEHIRSDLFKPFTSTKESLGTGLGLWVTRGMVEKHGGSVRFRSSTRSPSGTVFRMYLPETGHPQLFTSPSSSVLQ